MSDRLIPRSRLRSSPALLALPLAACAVGPTYQPPAPTIAPAWVGPAGQAAVSQEAWWREFGDPLLDQLVTEMLAGSPSLREAQARLAEARANRDAVRGGSLPRVNGSATGNETMLSKNGQFPVRQIPGFAREFPLFDIGFDASWEIDLWGRQARQNEAADARVQSVAASLEATRLQLTAELARAYVDLRLAQSDLDLARAIVTQRRDLAELTGLRTRAGEATAIESQRAGSELDAAQAAVAGTEATVRNAALRIAVLVGAAPAAMLPRLEAVAPIPQAPAAIGAGLPSELLRRRPDIVSAERALAAATADIGVATADLFPRLSLGVGVGQQARAVADLFDGDSTRLQAGPSLLWPIFNGGRARAMVRAADARAQATAARYDAAVSEALADSEGAINRFDRSLAALAAASSAAERESAAAELVRTRVQAGEDDRLALARAELARIGAVQRLAQARAQAASAAVALHKALGGGWQTESR